MGQYTGIKAECTIRDEIKHDMVHILNAEWERCSNPKLAAFGEYSRSSQIPCGSVDFMPYSFTRDYEGNESYNPDTGKWVFICAVKNYDYTIEEFMKLIPIIVYDIDIMCVYDEATEVNTYITMEDGKLFGDCFTSMILDKKRSNITVKKQ